MANLKLPTYCPDCGSWPVTPHDSALGAPGFLMGCGSHVYIGGGGWRSNECYRREIAIQKKTITAFVEDTGDYKREIARLEAKAILGRCETCEHYVDRGEINIDGSKSLYCRKYAYDWPAPDFYCADWKENEGNDGK